MANIEDIKEITKYSKTQLRHRSIKLCCDIYVGLLPSASSRRVVGGWLAGSLTDWLAAFDVSLAGPYILRGGAIMESESVLDNSIVDEFKMYC